ncbi:MAG: hypothetical protein AB7S57_00220, partial [Acetobacteraceae bacterium]
MTTKLLAPLGLAATLAFGATTMLTPVTALAQSSSGGFQASDSMGGQQGSNRFAQNNRGSDNDFDRFGRSQFERGYQEGRAQGQTAPSSDGWQMRPGPDGSQSGWMQGNRQSGQQGGWLQGNPQGHWTQGNQQGGSQGGWMQGNQQGGPQNWAQGGQQGGSMGAGMHGQMGSGMHGQMGGGMQGGQQGGWMQGSAMNRGQGQMRGGNMQDDRDAYLLVDPRGYAVLLVEHGRQQQAS